MLYNIFLEYIAIWGRLWRRGTKIYCKRDWLCVRSPLEGMKHFFKYIFHFFALVSTGTQQGRQRDPSARTLRSPLSAKFWFDSMRPVVAQVHKLWLYIDSIEMKYLLKFIFLFLRSGVETKRGVEFCHSTLNAPRIRQN